VFTTSGALVGLVIGQPESPAIVPASTVMSLAERLLEEGPKRSAGWLGIDVQALTPQIRAATGLTSGVVVTWVEPQGAAAGKIIATDIIGAANDQVIQTKADWDAHTARVTARENVTLRIWRAGRTERVQVTALEPRIAAASSRLGLTMRYSSGVGAEVLFVEEGSAAMRAGIAVGDVLTRVGDIAAPRPAQINVTFAAASKDGALLVAITRRTERLVVALVKQ
jgi:S1-C subfamily serine protease